MSEKKYGEKLRVRTSRKMYFFIYAMIFILLATLAVVKITGKPLNNFAFNAVIIFSIVGLLATEIHRFQNTYEINDDSIVHQKGIFVKTTRKIALSAISIADFRQNPWQMLLGFGNVHVRMFSSDDGTELKNINNPGYFISFLEHKKEEKGLQ